jgi:hypothetical protein
MAATLPFIPNELIIQIISYIDDPRFLWTLCRKVSPEFKKWSEDQYAREHLPKLRLEVHVSQPFESADGPHLVRSEYLFYLQEPSSLRADDAAGTAILKPRGPPFAVMRAHRPGTLTKITDDSYFTLLEDLGDYEVRFQAYPEINLGLRPQNQGHVCPCRSLRDQIRRGFCDRYIGTELFLRWYPSDRVYEFKWKEFLDHVHSKPCRP